MLWTCATLGRKEKEQQLREYMWKTELPCNPSRTLTPDSVTDYEYDYDNRLVEVSLPTNNDTVEYTYDAMGRRLTKKFTYHNGTNTDVTTYKYHYIGGQITEIEIDAIRNPGEGQTVLRNEEVKIHLGANSQPISYEWVKHVGESTTSATYYYHYDIHGNVLKITDSSENTKITYTYDVLGKILTETNPDSVLNFFTFRGASQTIWDSEVGMYYSGGYYRPDTGTSLQGTGAPVLTNPASGAMISAMAQVNQINRQMAIQARRAATTAGSASGGSPGGISPPAGPSDGIAHAGEAPPPPNPEPPPVGIISNDKYSSIFTGTLNYQKFGGIEGPNPKDGQGPNPGPGKPPPFGDDLITGHGDDVKEAESLAILLIAHETGTDPRVLGQMHNNGVSIDKLKKIKWIIWGNYDIVGKGVDINADLDSIYYFNHQEYNMIYILGYQIEGEAPRFFWGPQLQHGNDGNHIGHGFGDEGDDHSRDEGTHGYSTFQNAWCFMHSWLPTRFYIKFKGFEGYNSTDGELEVLLWGENVVDRYEIGTGKPVFSTNQVYMAHFLIPVNGGKVNYSLTLESRTSLSPYGCMVYKNSCNGNTLGYYDLASNSTIFEGERSKASNILNKFFSENGFFYSKDRFTKKKKDICKEFYP